MHKTNTFGLEKENLNLSEYIDTLDVSLIGTKLENCRLKEELVTTNKILKSFTLGAKKLNKFLDYRKSIDDTCEL